MNAHEVYDLGEIQTSKKVRATQSAKDAFSDQSYATSGMNPWVNSFSVLVPGLGQMLRREFARGLGFLSCFAFLLTLAWSLLITMDRLSPTLEILGTPGWVGVWCFVGLILFAMFLHLWNVLDVVPWKASAQISTPHPIVSGLGSVILPGLGQALNSTPWRAVVLLLGVWVAAAAWLLSWDVTSQWMNAYGLELPSGLTWMTEPVFRWAFPILVWVLAFYDAVSTATRRRSSL